MTLTFDRSLYIGNRELKVSIEATYAVSCDPYFGADADGNRYEPRYDATVTSYRVVDQRGNDLTEDIRASSELNAQINDILDEHAGEAADAYTGDRYR